MMGRQDGQMEMIIMDLRELIPDEHLLKQIDRHVSFDFIYEMMKPLYADRGRKSIDPVCIMRMLFVGYLYGIKSERRLVEDVQLNLAYRWFCGFKLSDKIPDHSTFSQNRRRRWKESTIFQDIFVKIVKVCMEKGLVDGESMAVDGSYLPASVSRSSWVDVERTISKSMNSYLDALDQELSQQPGFKALPPHEEKETQTTSTTDYSAGYIHHGTKRGVGYLLETTVDCKHGIVTGIDVYPANQKESLIVLRHLEKQQKRLGLAMQKAAMDRGYDTGAVHRGLELLGIEGYIAPVDFPNTPAKYGFSYDEAYDRFICPQGQYLIYHRLNCNKSTGKYLRCYQADVSACANCANRASCLEKSSIRRRILASGCYPAFFRGHQRTGSPEYKRMMRLRKIWAEGSYAAMKREHLIQQVRKRGLPNASEECILAAIALNLKRMAAATLYLFLSILSGVVRFAFRPA